MRFDPRLPLYTGSDMFTRDLVRRLIEAFREVAGWFPQESNVIPTKAGSQQGEFVKNNSPALLGAPGSQYVLQGWEYIGTTWVERRTMTGT